MEKIWLKHYPKGVPADITKMADSYGTLINLFLRSCELYTNNTAYISMGSKISFTELKTQAIAFAAWLQHNGFKKGDKLAIMLPNLLSYPVCLFGTWLAGGVVSNTNPLYTAAELQHQLSDSEATTIVVAENFAHTLQLVLPKTKIKRVIVARLGDLHGGFKGSFINFAARYLKNLVPSWNIANTVYLADILKKGTKLNWQEPQIKPNELAALQYTGGTTGVAKGAMLSHYNLVSNVCQAYSWVKPYCKGEQEQILSALPLYHIFALTANCLTFLMLGASNLLIVDARNMNALLKDIKKYGFTAITGVNTLFNGLLNRTEFQQLDFSKLSLALGGGMAVQASVAKRWLETTGVPIAQAYGLTETSPAVTINPLDNIKFDNSIGLPVSSTLVDIRNNNQSVANGELGEICVKGPQVTSGYYNRPEESRHIFDEDGWLLTGDIGYMDERGYIFIKDRKKDMILVSGFNVFPNEIEAAATMHPGILEAAAIGVPSESSGEAVKLFVIKKDPSLTAEDVIAHCRKLLTGYKVPKFVEFRDTLPRSNVGKILRKDLRPN